jgi:hypothetical protein
MQAGAAQLTAGPNGVTLGRFGWADNVTGQVSSVYALATQLGFVLPRFGTWNLLYCQDGTWILREGMTVTLAVKGDFAARFPGGAYPGQQVWANTADGSAAAGIEGPEWTADTVVTADSIVYTADGGGYQATQWTVMDFVIPGQLGRITSWQPPFFN